jgi:hypothetical protein
VEARRLFEEVLAGQTAELGPTHLNTLRFKGNLANLLVKLGQRAEARRLYEEVVAGQTAQLGPANSSTLLTKGNLATLLQETGESVEARRLYEEVLAGQTVELGPAHEDTLVTKLNLAVLHMGDLAGALPLFEDAVAGFTKLGPGHPHVQMAVQNLAYCRQDLGATPVQSLASAPAPAPAPAVVLLKGLVGAAQHNGQQAAVLRFDAGRGRFVLRLQDADGTQLRAKLANIEVVAVLVGLAVEVGGLVGAAEHNGKRGTVVGGPDPKTGRNRVRLDGGGDSDGGGGGGGKPLGLKPANLRLLELEGQ